jgi:predicted ATPase with chaperone activity
VGELSACIPARIQAARNIQQARFSTIESSDSVCNADLRVEEIRQFCRLQEESQNLKQAATCTAQFLGARLSLLLS